MRVIQANSVAEGPTDDVVEICGLPEHIENAKLIVAARVSEFVEGRANRGRQKSPPPANAFDDIPVY